MTEADGVLPMMVTSEAELPQLLKALDAGANEYVMKPFTRQTLFEKLGLPEADACARSES